MALRSGTPSSSSAAASTAAECCKPAHSTMIGQPCRPSCRTRSVRRSAAVIVWTSSTVTSSERPRHACCRLVRSSIALSGCRTRGRSPCTPNMPDFKLVILASRSVAFLASASLAPAKASIRATSCSGSWSKSPVVRFSTEPPTVEAKRSISCVLPTPWTPSTSTMPPKGSPSRQTPSWSSRSFASSCLRPAKCGGGWRSEGNGRSTASPCIHDTGVAQRHRLVPGTYTVMSMPG